jgi:hypothetical protein
MELKPIIRFHAFLTCDDLFGWLVLVCSERRVLLADCGWLLVAGSFREKSTAGWWLISRANRL